MAALIVVVAAYAAAPAVAQGSSYTTETFGDRPFSPFRPRREGPPPPAIRLRVERSVALLGPLAPGLAELQNGSIRVPLSVGHAVVDLDTGTVREAGDVPAEPVGETEWVIGGPAERFRFRSEPGNPPVLAAERRSKGPDGAWKRRWMLRVPGLSTVPLVIRDRVFVGTRDNRVLGLRAKNGHRLWSQDVGDRVLAPLSPWSAEIAVPSGAPRSVAGILVVPEDGKRVIVLDPFDGAKLATLEIPGADARADGGAVAAPDGRIVLLVRGYAPEDVSLLVARAEAAPSTPAPLAQEIEQGD